MNRTVIAAIALVSTFALSSPASALSPRPDPLNAIAGYPLIGVIEPDAAGQISLKPIGYLAISGGVLAVAGRASGSVVMDFDWLMDATLLAAGAPSAEAMVGLKPIGLIETAPDGSVSLKPIGVVTTDAAGQAVLVPVGLQAIGAGGQISLAPLAGDRAEMIGLKPIGAISALADGGLAVAAVGVASTTSGLVSLLPLPTPAPVRTSSPRQP